jgi:dissimilatory sulfite reductase (desulfoviridin) alpha/beta subunit
MVENFQVLKKYEHVVARVIAVELVWYSSRVEQLEAVIMSWFPRMGLTRFAERLRVGVFHQHVNEELLWP